MSMKSVSPSGDLTFFLFGISVKYHDGFDYFSRYHMLEEFHLVLIYRLSQTPLRNLQKDSCFKLFRLYSFYKSSHCQLLEPNRLKTKQIWAKTLKTNQIRTKPPKTNKIRAKYSKSNHIRAKPPKTNQIWAKQLKKNHISQKRNQIWAKPLKTNKIRPKPPKMCHIRVTPLKTNQIWGKSLKD